MKFRKRKFTLHMRSGDRLFFHADSVTKHFKGNELIGLDGEGTVGWPFYFRLDDIAAVTSRIVWGFWL